MSWDVRSDRESDRFSLLENGEKLLKNDEFVYLFHKLARGLGSLHVILAVPTLD